MCLGYFDCQQGVLNWHCHIREDLITACFACTLNHAQQCILHCLMCICTVLCCPIREGPVTASFCLVIIQFAILGILYLLSTLQYSASARVCFMHFPLYICENECNQIANFTVSLRSNVCQWVILQLRGESFAINPVMFVPKIGQSLQPSLPHSRYHLWLTTSHLC